MKETLGYKVTVAVAWMIHVFGASALVITVLALCGVHMNWQIGALCAVPGWLMIRALTELAHYEREKMLKAHMERWVERTEREIEHREEEKSENQGEKCRFCEDGKCTFGDGTEGCAYSEGQRIQSCEDPDMVYIQEGDIRRIVHEGKEVGWYRWK